MGANGEDRPFVSMFITYAVPGRHHDPLVLGAECISDLPEQVRIGDTLGAAFQETGSSARSGQTTHLGSAARLRALRERRPVLK
jgi:hypothetical protein